MLINRFPYAARQSARLLLSCILLSGLAFAQENTEAKYAEAVKAINEAAQLFDKGSEESLKQAINKYEEAGAIFRSLNRLKEEDLCYSSIGRAYGLLGQFQQAIDAYSRALKIRRDLKDEAGTGITLTHIGSAYHQLKEFRKSVGYYTQAREIWRAINDTPNEATSLMNLCYIYLYDELNEKQKAIESCTDSLPLWEKLGDSEGEAEAHYLLGQTYGTLDEDEKALGHYTQALSLYRKVKDRAGESEALHRIAMAYNLLGKPDTALTYYNQALPILREIKDLAGLSAALDNMGLIYASSGNTQKALEQYQEALRLAREAKDHEGEAAVLGNMGRLYDKMDREQEALDYYLKALALKQDFGDRRLEANLLNSIGIIYRDQGNYQESRRYYLEAQKISQAIGDRAGQVNCLFNLSRLDALQNDLRTARGRIEEAIAIIESLRAVISDQELRTSYFSTVQDYYDFYIEILMRLHEQQPAAGHNAEALQVGDGRRARALLETLVEAKADIRQGIDPKLVERERSLQQRLNAKAQEQMKLLAGRHTEEQAIAIANEIEAVTTELQQVKTEIRQTSPRYAALTQSQPLTLKEIQTLVLDADTLLLEYSLGPVHSYLWAVTQNEITSYELPEREEVKAAAREVYNLIDAANQTAEAEYDKVIAGETDAQREARVTKAVETAVARASALLPVAAARLSKMVLAPVAAQLGNKRLLIVSDGALQYIPFAALPDPNATGNLAQPLIVEHEIVSLPSASALAELRKHLAGRKPAAKAVAVLADPVFDASDERVGQKARTTPGNPSVKPKRSDRQLPLGLERAARDLRTRDGEVLFERLPGTRSEATKILSLVPAAQSKQALDFAASRATATSVDLSQYRYVHFATHGILDSANPELSGLVFSLVDEGGRPQDGYLRAHEIYNLKLPAELVVLSACETGLGKEIRGEGLVGMTRGFMYAGTPRIVVSLWSVSDEATAELMARFYRKMLVEKLTPAQALRVAQISLLNDKRFASPFYWAAFILQGEWR